MNTHFYLFWFATIFTMNSIFGQNETVPIHRAVDLYYEDALIRGEETYFFAKGYKSNDFALDLVSKDFGSIEIKGPALSADWVMPFYVGNRNFNNVITGWIYPKTDSLIVLTTSYNLDQRLHEKLDSIKIKRDLGPPFCTKPNRFQNKDYVIISITNQGGPAKAVVLLKVDMNGKLTVEATQSNPGGVITGGLFSLVYVVDFDVLNESRLLLRGDVNTGLAICDFNFDFIDHEGGVYIDGSTGKRYVSESLNFGINSMQNEIWTIGLGVNLQPFRLDPIHFVYNVDNDDIYVDTIYLLSNPENRSHISGTSVILKENDLITCTNPHLSSDWKVDIPSEVYFKRITNKQEKWHASYSSEKYIRVRDVIKTDSCEVLVAGSIYDYFGDGILQGFYAFFDCDGNLITSNVQLTETEMTVFPNPTNGPLYLEGVDQGQYVIFDLLGRTVVQGEIDGGEIDLGPIGPGAYLLKIEGSNEVVNFVKE